VSTFVLYGITGVLLFCLALYGVLARGHLLRKVMALNMMGSGVFLLLISVAERNRLDVPDPVPQAMVLTGIVVTLAVTAFAISLARRVFDESGRMSIEPEEDR
jgi:multicomponent Na+:H+ antiporter subunit C